MPGNETAVSTQLTPNLQSLLNFISGQGHHWGSGIITRPWLKEKMGIHNDCLQLEQLGFIYRHWQDGNRLIVWKSKEVL